MEVTKKIVHGEISMKSLYKMALVSSGQVGQFCSLLPIESREVVIFHGRFIINIAIRKFIRGQILRCWRKVGRLGVDDNWDTKMLLSIKIFLHLIFPIFLADVGFCPPRICHKCKRDIAK